MRSQFLSRALALAVWLGVVGCASQDANSECSTQTPATCPDTSLTYSTTIGATLTEKCSPCHAEGGVQQSVLLTDFNSVSRRLTSVAGQLRTCSMPPLGAAALEPAARQAIIDWIVCGAPR